MNDNEEKIKNSRISKVTTDDSKSEVQPTGTESDEESDGCDNTEEEIYKNLTEEQLLRARKFFECFICQRRCASFSKFRNHVFQHTNVNKYKCEKCFKEFAQIKYLKAHLTTHNEGRVFFCEICSQNFATKSSIRGHMRVHTGEKPYKCSVCHRAFSESSTRRKHMLTHFPEIREQLTQTFSCEICGKVIKGRDSFKRHIQIHTGDNQNAVECLICSKSFARKSLLRAHIVIHTDRPKTYICNLCSKAFYHRSSLWKHKKNSCLRQKPAIQCDMCETIFKEKVVQIQGNEEGKCKLCGKIFGTARGLSVHLRTHITDKKFQCTICANRCTAEGI